MKLFCVLILVFIYACTDKSNNVGEIDKLPAEVTISGFQECLCLLIYAKDTLTSRAVYGTIDTLKPLLSTDSLTRTISKDDFHFYAVSSFSRQLVSTWKLYEVVQSNPLVVFFDLADSGKDRYNKPFSLDFSFELGGEYRAYLIYDGAKDMLLHKLAEFPFVDPLNCKGKIEIISDPNKIDTIKAEEWYGTIRPSMPYTRYKVRLNYIP
ncbi:MAG: hypothetical protein JNL74_13945 [Fibrobacteres bacterium]|nr:hypothetical protein [Fibrobacterota bacterium]